MHQLVIKVLNIIDTPCKREVYCTVLQATDTTIRRILTACWITISTNTHSEYVIIFITFPQQKWLQERASVLHNTYIVCIVSIKQ